MPPSASVRPRYSDGNDDDDDDDDDDDPSQAQQPTHAELEHKRRLQQAEDNFFNSLKTDREDRIAAGKPLIYSDAM